MKVEVYPLSGFPEVEEGTDLARHIVEAATKAGLRLRGRDVVVVKQKVVSKAEGRLVELRAVRPGKRATSMAKALRKDPRLVELILRESVRVVRMGHGVIITETRHGFVCANSGVDKSNVKPGFVALLPVDPDRSADAIRKGLRRLTSKNLAVVVSDTFGRPWRNGQTDVAIGSSGIAPLYSYAGRRDPFGYRLRVTEPAVVDEIAAAAELVTGKLRGVPAAVVRGVDYHPGAGGVRSLVMEREKDLFR
jgi:coenzyme F420-0:L-glutamate ligase / coenzyme F420-1:gamma-L-glutamate ligase